MNQKALLVVSFGTTYHDTMEKSISTVEAGISAALPDRVLYRAFTSGMILHRLESRDKLHIDNVPQALEHILAAGCTDVLIQPTHIMNGDEYDKLCTQAAPYAGRFVRLTIGDPLLTVVGDYLDLAGVLMAAIPAPEADEAVVFMGHGTGHHANAAYCQLEYVLHDQGWNRAFVGTVEGYPTLAEVVRRLAEQPQIKKINLYPLMLVAGDHARNDMAGEEADTWKTQLKAAGYEVSCTLQGLGEYPGVQALFAHRAARADEKT